MSDLAQILKRMPFFLQRIGIVAGAFQNHFCDLQLKRLLRLRGQYDFPCNSQRRACQIFGYILKIGQIGRVNKLSVAEIRSIVQLDKPDRTVVAVGSDPSLQLGILDLIGFHGAAGTGHLVKFSDGHECKHTFLLLFVYE